MDNFAAVVKQLDAGDLPPVLDVENPKLWQGLSAKRSADMTIEWLIEVEKRLGMKPIIYTSYSFVGDVLGADKRLAGYQLWMARYRTTNETAPKPFTKWAFWQFTDTGAVDGITGHVDRNVFDGTVEELLKLTKQAVPIQRRRRKAAV